MTLHHLQLSFTYFAKKAPKRTTYSILVRGMKHLSSLKRFARLLLPPVNAVPKEYQEIRLKIDGPNTLLLQETLLNLRRMHANISSFDKTLRVLVQDPTLLERPLITSANETITLLDVFNRPLTFMAKYLPTKIQSSSQGQRILFENNNLIEYALTTPENFLEDVYQHSLRYITPSIEPIEGQVSGLVSLNANLRKMLNINNVETKKAKEFITISYVKVLALLRTPNLSEKSFLLQLRSYLGAINTPMPELLQNSWGSLALLQHCFRCLTPYTLYEKMLLTEFSHGAINVDYIDSHVSSQSFVEQRILSMSTVENIIRNNPKVKLYMVEPKYADRIPYFDKAVVFKICGQSYSDFYALVHEDDSQLIISFCRPQDVKTGGERALTHSRITITHHMNDWDDKKIKTYLLSHVTQTKNLMLATQDVNEKEHLKKLLLQFMGLLDDIKKKHTDPQKLLQTCLEIKKSMLYNPKYKNIYPSITADAGISTEFLDYMDKHSILVKIQSSSHEELDLDVAFPKNGIIKAIPMRNMLEQFTKNYFPVKDQRTILANLDRLGVGQTVLYIEG